MALSPISLPSVSKSELSQEPMVKSELKNIRLENSILAPLEHKGATLLSDNVCSELKSSDSILINDKSNNKPTIENKQQKKNDNKITNKDIKGSNSVSNKKKAQGQIIALSLTTIIGAVLAPITGGMSLLPTAFLVVYGNAAAIAMYGGSKHFLDDIKKHQEQEIEPETTPSNTAAKLTPTPFSLQTEPNIDKNDPNPFGNGRSENVPSKPQQFNKQTVDEKVEETDPQPQSLVGDILEYQLIGNDKVDGDKAVLQEAIAQFLRTPISKCISTEQNLTQANFSTPIKKLLEEKGISAELNPNCAVSDSVHSGENLQVFAIRNMPEINQHTDLVTPENNKKNTLGEKKSIQHAITAPMDYLKKPVITSTGSAVPMSGNYLSGVRHNVVDPQGAPSAEKVAQTPSSNEKASSAAKPTPHVITAPMDYLKKPVITSTGSAAPMSGNYLSGVRHNVVDPQGAPSAEKVAQTPPSNEKASSAAKPAPHVITAPMDYLKKPVISSAGSAAPMSGNYLSGVRHNILESQSTSSLEKPIVAINKATKDSAIVNQNSHQIAASMDYLKKSVITSIGSAISMNGNYQSGVRHNVDDFIKNHSENVKELAHSYWVNTGITKPVSLAILNRSLAVPPVNQEQLDYITKNK